MATPTFTEIYKKTGTAGTAADYEVVAKVGVGGVPLAVMKGASSSAAGVQGLVPAPASGNQAKYLRGDGTWQTPPYPGTASTSANGLMTSTMVSTLNSLNKKMGTTDISGVGSTVTEAIHNLNSNLNNQYIQTGCATTVNSNGYFRYKVISFPVAYSSPPIVVATVINNSNSATDAHVTTLVKTVTNTTAEVYVGNIDAALANITYKVNWIAIGSKN